MKFRNLFLVLFFTFTAVGCGSSDVKNFTDPKVAVVVSDNEKFQITLKGTGIAGITWTLDSQGDTKVIKYLSQSTMTPEPPDELGTTSFEFQAVGNGTTQVVLKDNRGNSDTFNITVN